MARQKQSAQRVVNQDDRLFRLQVQIIGGPMTERFVKKNKTISRTIEIRGDQTLEDLHGAIFDAFDRDEEHMYEFQIGGKRPMDPKARKYVLPMAMDHAFGKSESAGTVDATIGSLGLKKGDTFAYWFDFGDDWWHQIDVLAIEEKAGHGEFPKIINRVGASPPQYVDWDEEDGE